MELRFCSIMKIGINLIFKVLRLSVFKIFLFKNNYWTKKENANVMNKLIKFINQMQDNEQKLSIFEQEVQLKM